MKRKQRTAEYYRWNRLSESLLRWVEVDRAEEIKTHIGDATQAGAPLEPIDAASVARLAAATITKRQLPLFVAGLPIAMLCILAYGSIYESHFMPWDLMEETPSTNPAAATARMAINNAWLVVLPVGLVSGWRAALCVRQGRPLLPAVFVVALLTLIFNADLFIERTTWFGDGSLQPRHVDAVSPYSLALLGLTLLIPVAFLALEQRSRRRLSPSVARLTTVAPATSTGNPDHLALAAIGAPVLIVVMPLAALTLFLFLVWLAPSFQLRHKIWATIAATSPLVTAAVLAGSEGVDDPGMAFVGFAGFFIAIWAWLAKTTLGMSELRRSV